MRIATGGYRPSLISLRRQSLFISLSLARAWVAFFVLIALIVFAGLPARSGFA
jgi:hypothetical protein